MKDSPNGDAEQTNKGEEAVSKTPLGSATEPVATPSQIAGEGFEQVGSVTAEVPVDRPASDSAPYRESFSLLSRCWNPHQSNHWTGAAASLCSLLRLLRRSRLVLRRVSHPELPSERFW